MSTKMHIKLPIYFGLVFIVLLSGCTMNSNIEVLNESALQSEFSIDTVVVTNDTGQVFDIDIESMLTSALIAELNSQGLSMKSGFPYSLDVSIIQYKKGNAFSRWLMPGMGATVLSVEARINDDEGNVLTQSQATRSIGAGGGYTIGAWSRVFGEVANELIDDVVSVQ
jgi:hypothetical protein